MTLRASGSQPELGETILTRALATRNVSSDQEFFGSSDALPWEKMGQPRRLLWFRVQGDHPSEAVDVNF